MVKQNKGKIFWHAPFFEGLQLELYQYKDYLTFEDEHQLSKEALIVDVLVIKKEKGIKIDKDIGRIFRGHNLVEFKSETDSLSIRDFNKVIGYAYIYSSFTDVPLSDITVTFALTIYPEALEKYLENEFQQKIEDMGNGIYYINNGHFPIQILESKKLSKENLFLRSLRSNLTVEDAVSVVQEYGKLKDAEKKNAYLDGLIKANFDTFREAMKMGEAAKELFLEAAEEYGWREKFENERAKEIAKKLLSLGDPTEKVAEATNLPIEVVRGLARNMVS